METINTRLRYLRKDVLDMTQEEFSNAIGLKRNTIALIETNKNVMSDRTISDICREFNVNEEWLRNGTGEIFAEDIKSEIDAVCQKYKFSTLERNILENFATKDERDRKQFLDFATSLVNGTTDLNQLIGAPNNSDITITNQNDTSQSMTVSQEDYNIMLAYLKASKSTTELEEIIHKKSNPDSRATTSTEFAEEITPIRKIN